MKEVALFFGDTNIEVANKLLEEITSIIDAGSFIPIKGVWRGTLEHSYMLILSEEEFQRCKEKIIRTLKKYEQEALFVLYIGEGYLLYTHAEEEVVV